MSARGLRKCMACDRKVPVKTVRKVDLDGWLCKAEHQCRDAARAKGLRP